MNEANGFIVLNRKILDWEWYKDNNTKVLFIHLLLKANYKDMSFEGRKILRGQLVTSLPSLSSQTGLSVRQVRVSLDHLKMTGEVTSTSYPKYRVITVVKYDEYQSDDRQNGRQMTGKMSAKRQADDSQMTGKRQASDRQMTASKQYNNTTKEQEEQIESTGTAKRFTPPTLDDITAYCRERGNDVDPERFLDYYTSNGWRVGKNPMKDWKAAVRTWEKGDNNFGQHSKHGGKDQESDWPDYSFLRDTVINL